MAAVTCALVSIFIKDRILYKQIKAARGGTEGSFKNKERIDLIKAKGGPRLSTSGGSDPLLEKKDKSDLEYLSRRNLNKLEGNKEDEEGNQKLNTSRSSSNSNQSRRSRKIHGYGTRLNEEVEDQVTFTPLNDKDNGNKDKKLYAKSYLPNALKGET